MRQYKGKKRKKVAKICGISQKISLKISKNFQKFAEFRKNFTKNYFHLLCYDNKTQHINLKSKFANFFLNSFSKKVFINQIFVKFRHIFSKFRSHCENTPKRTKYGRKQKEIP